MRIFITGSNGFLAQKFCEIVKERELPYQLLGTSKSVNRNVYLSSSQFEQLDLCSFDLLKLSLDRFKPTHILHTAAITSVEGCEQDKELAYTVNVLLTQYLSEYCKAHDIHLTFLSTDFVFDGENGPYDECAATNPINYYGQTKVLAEEVIASLNIQAAVLRTILVYGVIPDKSRSNLVLWAKKELEQNKSIKVVSDQWRMPTWVDDLAHACLLAIQKNANGTYHISGGELMSVEETVKVICHTFNFNLELLSAISSQELGQDKNRPRKTGFVLCKSKRDLQFEPTPFVKSLEYICKQLEKYGD